MSAAEESLAVQLRALRIAHVREHRFAAEATGGTGRGCRQRLVAQRLKDWRFDFAMPERRLAVEVEGGAWTGGRHTRGTGFHADLRKYAAAARLGWTVIRVDPAMIRSGEAIDTVRSVLQRNPPAGQRVHNVEDVKCTSAD